MSQTHPMNACIETLTVGSKAFKYFSLPRLQASGAGELSRLPVSLRIVLESLVRNLDGQRVGETDVRALCQWQAQGKRTQEVPFVVARVLLQDFTGVPLVVDLATMRSAVVKMGKKPEVVQPLVPVDLVIDHSVQVDHARTQQALDLNMRIEFERNQPRYEFLKWGMKAFQDFSIVPPGIGIVHQVNLEYLARGVLRSGDFCYPDTVVGTDSHTTMINGLGVVGWGVGGIEAEAGMLGQPNYLLMPDVFGVYLHGAMREGVTATDVVLYLTERLRKENVVGQFVEFHGPGAAAMPVAERATIANMAPEYGATMGFFPIDEETCQYLLLTGRSEEHVALYRNYYKAQDLFGMPERQQCDYTRTLEVNLGDIAPCVSGPKRPQDRIALTELKSRFRTLLTEPQPNGYGKVPEVVEKSFGTGEKTVRNGDVLIAAITSCTNTSNPGVMLAAGLLAKKARERGLSVPKKIKTSLAPGSRVVTAYLEKTGLLPYLEELGFNLVGYGCTTCIGNSGPLDSELEKVVTQNDVVTASVLSGNRNFEARVHANIKANFLMSPPLVVALAIAGRVDIDLEKEPLGTGSDGQPVMLADIWPSAKEIQALTGQAKDPATYRALYSDLGEQSALWKEVDAPSGLVYEWDPDSTYVQEPPYFEDFSLMPTPISDIKSARVLAVFGDMVTTDHISPAGAIKPDSPAGKYLQGRGVTPKDFNSYGARRGNHEVMIRGTFANVRIKNLLVPGVEGGVTVHQPSGERTSIYDAACRYQENDTPTIVFAGKEYGAGSSRDWAAKGTQLLGVRAVIAQSFERIHRSNLLGIGVLACEFDKGQNVSMLNLVGNETFDLLGIEGSLAPRQKMTLRIHRESGQVDDFTVIARIDTPIEVEYYRHGGIMPYVLRQLVGNA